MEEEFAALNFVKNNPFFRKDAEKRMSASFCGSMSLVCETVVMTADAGNVIRRPVSMGFRGPGILSANRSKSAFSLAQSEPNTMVVEGTTVKLRRTDSTRRKEMAARRETVEILMEEIVRENKKVVEEAEAEEMAASSGSDLEYGPGIVERLKAKFARISTGDSKKRPKHKRHHSVDDILEEHAGGEYGTYDRRQSRQLTVPERSTQTLDRSPRHSNGGDAQLSRRASRSMADLGTEDYGERRAFSLQRPSRREEYEREQQERLVDRLPLDDYAEDDMVDIRELRKMFDRPAEGGGGGNGAAPAPWRMDSHRAGDRFLERGRTHQNVPRDAPPPRELRLSAPLPVATGLSLYSGGAVEADEEMSMSRAAPLKKTVRRVSERDERPIAHQERASAEPEFVVMARRLRRATIASATPISAPDARHETASGPLAVETALAQPPPPADPAPLARESVLASPPSRRRDSFTGAATDVSPPPEEPKPPMRPSELDSMMSSTLSEDAGSRYSSLARSERSMPDSSSTHVPYSDLSLPRSDFSSASKASRRSVSTDGGVRMGLKRATSTERRSTTYTKIVPENQGTSGVEEMQRLLSKFSSRKPREENEEKEVIRPAEERPLLAAREAPRDEPLASDVSSLLAPTLVVLSPQPERRQTKFVPAIVGVRSSDGRQLLSPTPTSNTGAEMVACSAPALNVVSISVRDSAPSVIYTNNAPAPAAPAAGEAATLQPPPPQQCDEEDSDVRRSSVGSTASSSSSSSSISAAASIAESMTSSGCSSSEDLAAESLLPPVTPPRRESLEGTPGKSLSARYLEERGREYTVAQQSPEDESLLTIERSTAELSFDRSPTVYASSKPYGDEACTPPQKAAATPLATSTAVATPAAAAGKKVDEDAHAAAAAASEEEESPDACCIPTTTTASHQSAASDTCNVPADDLTASECGVTIVEIDEEEIVEDDEAAALQVRQPSTAADGKQDALEARQADSDSEIDTDDDGEIEDIANRALRLCLSEMHSPLMAGDGNPIRHSLIALAMEEDRPALLEAMSETFSFVFEDVDERGACTSAGIVRPAHKERRAKMKRIAFAAEVAGVYTYLDEQSAETEEEWREGAAVSIEHYHSMVAAATAEAEAAYMRNMDELARWNAAIAATESNVSSTSSDALSDLSSRHMVFST